MSSRRKRSVHAQSYRSLQSARRALEQREKLEKSSTYELSETADALSRSYRTTHHVTSTSFHPARFHFQHSCTRIHPFLVLSTKLSP
jgi:hypothetical protein